MALNVNRANADPFYRYKMPKLLAKVEGKGNGIKTVIANMTEIAKSLERPPMYPTKYFGCELGAQTNFDAKNERYIVNGEHDASRLQDLLDGFIKKFVLCTACENPETTLTVKRNAIHSKCKACGNSCVIDNKHKLSTYIIKNPPPKDVDYSKLKENGNGHATNGDVNGHDNDKSSNDDDEDDDWEPEPVADDVKLAAGISKLVIDRDMEKSQEERLDMLHQFFIKTRDANDIGDGKKLCDEAQRLELKQKAPLLLVDVLLNENVLKEELLRKYRKTFLRFTLNDLKAQRYFLGGIEQLIVKHEESLLAKTAHLLQAIYEQDICVEEAILAWGEKPSSKYVKKTKAKEIIERGDVFLKWLLEAEEEDEDDEEVIQFDDRPTAAKTVIPTKVVEEVVNTVQTEEGEIDINDI